MSAFDALSTRAPWPARFLASAVAQSSSRAADAFSRDSRVIQSSRINREGPAGHLWVAIDPKIVIPLRIAA